MAVRRFIRDARGRFASRGSVVGGRAKPAPAKKPAGSMTRMLRKGQRDLYRAEQDRMQTLMRVSGGGSVAGMRIIRRNIKAGAASRSNATTSITGATKPGSVSQSLRGTLRQLAQSDARYYRELGNTVGATRSSASKRVSGSSSRPRRKLKGS